jgi:hypothetical protein
VSSTPETAVGLPPWLRGVKLNWHRLSRRG